MSPIDHAIYRMSNDVFAIGVPTGILRRLLMIGLREVEEQELKTETFLVDPEQFERLRKEFYPDSEVNDATRTLVCGGRHYADVIHVWRTLDLIDRNSGDPGIRMVIDGNSDDLYGEYRGADYWGHQWALARNRSTVRCPALWKQYGKAAGPRRNKQMLDEFKPTLVVAFPEDNGTRNMIDQAERAGVQVIRADPAFPLTSPAS